MSERGEVTVGSNWDKINFAADGSGVLLGLLLHGDEQTAQNRLDQMSVDQLLTLEAQAEVVVTLAWTTRQKKIHEGRT